jgi:SMI1-KNR4 cell-wall
MESHVVLDRIAAHTRAKALAVASQAAVGDAEAQLGFELPHLLKSIYLSLANGGFGPGYGLIGVAGGHSSNLGNLADAYHEIIRGAEYLGLKWPPRLLPFCEWGDNIFSCVDCSDQKNLVFRSDECKVRPLGYDLQGFFERWLDGVDLLSDGAVRRRTVEGKNPFTGRKTLFK